MLAAASSCQLLSFLAVAARARADVRSYVDHAEAVLAEEEVAEAEIVAEDAEAELEIEDDEKLAQQKGRPQMPRPPTIFALSRTPI